MSTARAAAAAAAVFVALLLQVSLAPHLAWQGVVPNLVLLVVVAAALTRGPQFAMVLGFAAGALLDLAPPADHTAGRWALALVVVGYVAGRVRSEASPTATTVVSTVAASSFVATSLFAMTGLLLGELSVGVGELLLVVGLAVVWDVVLTPFVLPPLMAMFRRLEPARLA
ncbi:MAG: rod shape-determining protein MreD [Nocardioides sp.]|uniref:rod shape-determining protein MreD n=1 Tax=Nocardioides sp. TaxID=35761 RepID=UPI0026099B5A|nr:rod shape-determining protein MreD [Nocardioides sp.]